MVSARHFHRVRRRRQDQSPSIPPTIESLLKLLAESVIEPFERAMHMTAVAVPLNALRLNDDEDPEPNPCHPACAQFASSDYCRESWQLHLVEAARHPEAHWHTCDFGMYCAVIPVACYSRCLAAVRLAAPASMSEETFDRCVVFLDILVENFVVSHAEYLSRLVREFQATEASAPPPAAANPVATIDRHPHVEQAIRYIEQFLHDSGLTVTRVARQLAVNTNYLCHLFAGQIGKRMSRYIADRRIELAKELLVTTHHQVKRIARDTGHAHSNWFCHVFSMQTGLSPGEYRKKNRTLNRD